MNTKRIFDLPASGMSPEEMEEHPAQSATKRTPIEERVYETLCGVLIPAARVPWVGSIAEPGLRYFEAYEEMHRAYERLRLRLGAEDEDADVEEIISCLLERERCIALKMFEYGRLYQQMQNRLEKK